MTHIIIGDVSPRIQYVGDGGQTLFTYPFPIFADADIEAYEDATLKTLTSDYTVAGAGVSSGGSITFVVAPASGVVVTLRRRLTIKRTSDFQEAGEFRAKVINDELDTITASVQQVNDDLGRSLRLAPTDSATSLVLPDKGTRASQYLGFDANGDPIATNAAGPVGPTGPAGNMDGANNLFELTNTVTARSNLGLVIGTDVLAPTGDGSGLAGISGTDNAARSNIAINTFKIAVINAATFQNMVDMRADVFTDETGVNVATSTNEHYDATNDYYAVGGFASAVPQATGTTIGNMSNLTNSSGGIAAAYDGNENQPQSTSAAGPTNTISTIGKDFGAGNDKNITQVTCIGSSDQGFMAAATTAAITLDVFGTTDGGITGGTLIGTTGSFNNVSGPSTKIIDTSANSTAFRGYYVEISAVVGKDANMAEVKAIETLPPLNMTLVSNAVTALSQPTNALIVMQQEDVDPVTPNTDLKAWVSRDGGTTWTQITLTSQATNSAINILTGSVDISAQPAGTSMVWKIETLNLKSQKIHAVALEWS